MEGDGHAERIVEANERLINSRDFAAAEDFFGAEYVLHTTDDEVRGDGPEVIRGFLDQLLDAFPDLEVTVDILVSGNDRVAWLRTHRGTHTGELPGLAPSEEAITWSDMVVTRFEGGMIVEEWAVSDLGERAAG